MRPSDEGIFMDEGIYRIKTTVGQASSKGIAIVTKDGIRAVDQKYFYVLTPRMMHGRKRWDTVDPTGYRYFLPPDFPMQFDYKKDGDSFRLDGEGQYANTKVSICSTRIEGL
jgi:hypothetical protein